MMATSTWLLTMAGYGQADAFDGDGALLDDVAGEFVGDGEAETPVGVSGALG